MGTQAALPKQRECSNCGQVLYTSAKELVEHARLCTRAEAAGLVLPGLMLGPNPKISRG